MATISTFRNDSVPSIDDDVSHLQKSFAVVNGSAANGDQIEVYKFPVQTRARLVSAVLRTSATLGVSCTLQLRINRGGVYTVISAATTAGAASKVDGSAQAAVPFDIQGGDIIEALVGGAGITADAAVTVDFAVANR